MCILCSGTTLSAGRPQRTIFRPHWPPPTAPSVWGCGLSIFFAIENMPPHFSAHGQTAGCIRIPLGTEVGSAQATMC